VTLVVEEPAAAFGDLGSSRGAAAAVAQCSQGGVAWPDSVQIYDSAGGHLASLAFEDFDEGSGERDLVESLRIADGKLVVEWATVQASDDACCPSRKVKGTFRLDGQTLVLDEITSHGDAPPWDRFNQTSEVMEALVPAWIRGDGAALDRIPMSGSVRDAVTQPYPGVIGQFSCDAVDSSAQSDTCYISIIEDESDETRISGEYQLDLVLDSQVGWKIVDLKRT